MKVINKYIDRLKYSSIFIQNNNLFFPQPFFLFRGEAKGFSNPAISTLERKGISERSDEIEHYRKCFKAIFPNTDPFQSDLNLRFIVFLQHYGFSTRLVDVTSSLRIALYFACNDHPSENGFIYKFFGYDIASAFAPDLDVADIDSLFFNPNFPPSNHELLQDPKPF